MNPSKSLLRFILIAIVGLAVWAVQAQTVNNGGPNLADRLNASVQPITERLSAIEKEIVGNTLNEQALTALSSELSGLSQEAFQKIVQFQPELRDLDFQIGRLPPKPAEGEPEESADIATQRERLFDIRAKSIIAIKDAEILSVRSRQLRNTVLEQRRTRFVQSILQQRRLGSEQFKEVFDEAPGAIAQVTGVMGNWIASIVRFNLSGLFLALGLTTIAAMVLYRILRPLRRWADRIGSEETLSALHKIMLAFFPTVIWGGGVAIVLGTLHASLGYFGVYRLRVDIIMGNLLLAIAGLIFVWLLITAILKPKRADRRMANVTDYAAARLRRLAMAVAVIYAVDIFVTELIELFSLSVSLTVFVSLISSLLIAIVMVVAVFTRLNPYEADAQRSGFRGWNPIVYWLLWACILAIAFSAVFGYVRLSRFIAGQFVVTGSILATMYLGFLTSRAISSHGAIASTRFGQRLSEQRGFTDFRLDQIGLLFSILTNILVLVVGIPVLLLQWGGRQDEIFGAAKALFTGFSVGGVEISLTRILFALIVFVLIVAGTRLVQRWFEGKILSRTHLDAGVKNSIRSGLGYLGYFLAGVVGISWAGFNLSNLALIAGALSVGIGFGLQNIVNNFVSGIIMLIERPIKVGDIINVGGAEGFVRKINVRATELETFDRQSVIIPNSEVINTSVGNWMHVDHMRRIIIRVGVAYGSDVELVRDVLLGTLNNDSRVASHPAAFVYFADFGASSLDFELRFFVRDLMDLIVVETDTRFAIDKAFRENNIEIPFPQTDLHLRSGFPVIKEAIKGK